MLELLNENLSARYGITPYELLVWDAPGTSKATQAISIALGWPQNVVVSPYYEDRWQDIEKSSWNWLENLFMVGQLLSH